MPGSGGALSIGMSVSPSANGGGGGGPMDGSSFTRLFNHSGAPAYAAHHHHAYATEGVFGGP